MPGEAEAHVMEDVENSWSLKVLKGGWEWMAAQLSTSLPYLALPDRWKRQNALTFLRFTSSGKQFLFISDTPPRTSNDLALGRAGSLING